MKCKFAKLSPVLALLISTSLCGQVITYEFSGFVANPGVGQLLGNSVDLGDEISGTFQYDIDSRNSSTFPDVGVYAQDIACGFKLSISGVELNANNYEVVVNPCTLTIQNIGIQEVAAISAINFSNFSEPVFSSIDLPDDSLTELDFEILIGSVDVAPFFQEAILFNLDFLSSSSEFLLGDINRDDNVDLLDIAPFVELLTNNKFQVEADFDQDGIVSLLDVAPFVEAIAG